MKNILFNITLFLIFLGLTVKGSLAQDQSNSEIPFIDYQWPLNIDSSQNYLVKILFNGNSRGIRTHISKPGTIPGPDGTGISRILTDRTLSFVILSLQHEVDVEVTKLFGTAADRVEISPKVFGINPYYFNGRTVRFKIKPGEYVSVNFFSSDNRDSDGSGGYDIRHGLMLFAETPLQINPEETGGNVIYFNSNTRASDVEDADMICFKPGIHDLKDNFPDGILRLDQGQKVHLEGGAVVYGGIYSWYGKDDIEISGHGILSGQKFYWHEIQPLLGLMGSSNSGIKGITVMNSPFHTINVTGDSALIENVKIINWAWNNDGIRLGPYSTADHLFIKTMDDHDYAYIPHKLINSVIWPMQNGAGGILGWSDRDGGAAVYRNNFYIHAEWDTYWGNRGIIASRVHQGAYIYRDTIEDLVCENNMAILANLTIHYDDTKPYDPSDKGDIGWFQFKNIFLEKDFRASNGQIVKQRITGFIHEDDTAFVHDIDFVNILAGDKLLTENNYHDYFDIDPATTYNIRFKTEGPFYTMKTLIRDGSGKISPPGNITIPEGMNIVLTITPDPGNKIDNVKVDGRDTSRIQVLSLKNIKQDHTIEVDFAKGNDYFNLETDISIIDKSEVEVYPNPSSGKIIVRNGRPFKILKVYSVNGLLYLEESNEESSDFFEIDVSSLPAGVFYLVLSNNKKFITRKICIQ